LLNNPGAEISIDVTTSTVTLPNGKVIEFPMDDFARYCIVEGIDQLEFLQQHIGEIEKFEENRSWTP
jgi:3-isopropylmalate/(R)-2-methylmalate dehydratase small subunit